MIPSVINPAAITRRGEAPIWSACLAITLAGLGFFLPFSSAGIAIAMGVLIVLALVRPRPVGRTEPWKEPVMAAGLLLFAYIAVHTLWTTGLQPASWQAVNRYHELLIAPLLLALLSDARHRRIFFRAVICGAVLVALMYWAAFLEPSLTPLFERRRISAGFALAVCAFVLLARTQGQPRPWPARALSLFLALTVLFAINARTGHLVLLVLAPCAAWLYSPRRWRWPAALACPLIVLAFALSSDAVRSRVDETLAGSQAANSTGGFTSTTIRIELIRLAADLSVRHGATGAGYANYPAVHAQAARERYQGQDAAKLQAIWARSANPHNEYVMQLVGGGVTALALFLAWLGLTFRHAARATRPVSGALFGMGLAFAVGCLFNSLLMDFIEGHVYMALLAWLLAESRYPALAKAPIERVLVIATRQIGDVLLTTPLIHSARRCWPQARIDVLAFAGTAGMLRGNPDVNQLLEYPARLGLRGLASLARQLRRRYDLALVADPGDRAHLIGWMAAPLRSGIVPAGGGSNWLKTRLLDHVVTSAGDLGTVHVTSEKRSLLDPWLAADGERPAVVPPPGEALPADVRRSVQPGAVVVHAPSMWPYKQWPLPHFQKLVSALLAEGRQVVLTGSASERDQECVAALRTLAAPPQLLDLSGQLDFQQLTTLLRGAALYIGPDTSVSHLAAATGVPVIAILGPTNPQRWAPWPARAEAQALFARSAAVQQVGNVTVLQGPQPCVPCGRAGCEDHRGSRSDCLVSITPERVLDEAMKILR
jgi:ADP-heptose:LPS heptosyltransferase/O-antigen ligase